MQKIARRTFGPIYFFSNKVNYYRLFDLPRNFTDEQLKAAYLELVKKYHPDLTDDPQAAELFKQVQEGYAILSDPERRK
jgi:DnaJ-class molecular chaperone